MAQAVRQKNHVMLFSEKHYFFFETLQFAGGLNSLLGRVPRVPGTRKILSFYVVAPVNFYEIPGKHLPCTRKILTPLISGTHGLIFLTRALHAD